MAAPRLPWFLSLILALALTGLAGPESNDKADGKKPIEMADILDWKSIGTAVLSDDGQWFAYRLSPNEGNTQVVLRHTTKVTEYRFDIGQVPSGGPRRFGAPIRRPTTMAISSDSAYAAFLVYPTYEENIRQKNRQAQRQGGSPSQRGRLYNKAAIVDLSDGKIETIEKVRSFRFSGDRSGWIAVHRYPSSPSRPGDDEDRVETGSDLILVELGTGRRMNIGNVSAYSFNKSGDWLAFTVATADESGNGLQIRDMQSGVVRVLDSGEAAYKRPNWNEEGTALTVLKGVKDEKFEDRRYSLLGFRHLDQNPPLASHFDPQTAENFPGGMTISPNRSAEWRDDFSAILFGIQELEPKEGQESGETESPESEGEEESEDQPEGPRRGGRGAQEDKRETADLVLWHWKDSRLQSMQQVQETRDKNFSYLAAYWPEGGRFVRLADETLREVSADSGHRWAVGTDRTPYEWMGNLDGRRYQDVYTVDLETGERTRAIEKSRWYFGPSVDGSQLLYYRDGHFYTYDIAAGSHHNITENVPVSFVDVEDDHNIVQPPIRPYGWSSDGKHVVLSDDWDVWKVAAKGDGGAKLTGNGREKGIRYRRPIRLDPEEDGIDLSRDLYLPAYEEWTKKAGIARLAGARPGPEMLLWGEASYPGLTKAKDGEVYLYRQGTHADYPDFYAAAADLANGRRLTEANPQQSEFLWSSGTRLIDYQSDKGDKLQAALFLPANYEEGKSYPTIVYIYEKMSQRLHVYDVPSATGFDKSVYTSNGYAVLMPDIVYKVDDPGMSSVWCVLPALKAAIATGVVDPEKVGLHGHSWGGYQTSFLITQTDMFSAAVAGAPLTNMISMYSSIYWNSGSANQPIFESSQGRFTGGPWDVLEAYTRNSPVYYAENVTTPLIILHNDKDGAVDFNQGIEYFNTLRRLKKPVVMLQYKGENHGLRKPANQKDYTVRMREFFDHHLKGADAPAWLQEGVPHLEHEDHLQERAPIIPAPPAKKEKEKKVKKAA